MFSIAYKFTDQSVGSIW